MKKGILALLSMIFTLGSFAQSPNPFPRTIQVNGSAEMEIVPDQIFVHVTLKEYDKKGQGKIDLEKIKESFLRQYKSIGMHDSLISIVNYDGMNPDYWWRKKKKKDELYSSITYQVKFSDSKKMDELVNRLDDDATQNFQVVRTSHSNMESIRKQLKISAVKAAKEKAMYLSEAAGEKIGVAITINEPQEFQQTYRPRYANKMETMASADMASEELPDVDFMKIKIRYDVNAVFALN
jgi:uncharacterized protein